MTRTGFSSAGFMVRWVVALVLVFATFNPTGHSFIHWVTDADAGDLPLKALAGIALLILYVIFLRATWRSIGPIGLVLAIAFFAALIWVLVDIGVLSLTEPTAITYAALVVLATVLAIGVSWSHVRRRISGQADMDDVGD